ncbi:Methyltransferase-like protein 24 [Nymphon striatum]|nr:Methyltransferase-like protein 24 [Nymphon striatum]
MENGCLVPDWFDGPVIPADLFHDKEDTDVDTGDQQAVDDAEYDDGSSTDSEWSDDSVERQSNMESHGSSFMNFPYFDDDDDDDDDESNIVDILEVNFIERRCSLVITMFVLMLFYYHPFRSIQTRIRRFPNGTVNLKPADIFLYLETPPAGCSSVVRLGGHFLQSMYNETVLDGDKIICEDPGPIIPRNNCLIYSFGSALEFSFEKAAYKRYGCEIHTFDPTVKITDDNKNRIPSFVKLHPFGIYDKNSTTRFQVLDLETIIKVLHHQHRTIHILKMDIEGDEWRVLRKLISTPHIAEKIHHLLVEIHLLTLKAIGVIFPGLENQGFQMFSARENLATPLKYFKEIRQWKPMCYELSFYKHKYVL